MARSQELAGICSFMFLWGLTPDIVLDRWLEWWGQWSSKFPLLSTPALLHFFKTVIFINWTKTTRLLGTDIQVSGHIKDSHIKPALKQLWFLVGISEHYSFLFLEIHITEWLTTGLELCVCVGRCELFTPLQMRVCVCVVPADVKALAAPHLAVGI